MGEGVLSLSFAFVPLVSSVFLSFVLASSLDMSFFFAHPWPSSLPVLLLSLPRSFRPRRFSRFFYLLLDFFFFCASVRCMCTTGPCVKVHRPNKPRTDWLALQPPRTPFALLTVRLSIPCDPLRDTMLTVPAVSLSLFPPVLFDGVVFIALVRWLSSSFTRRLINHWLDWHRYRESCPSWTSIFSSLFFFSPSHSYPRRDILSF